MSYILSPSSRTNKKYMVTTPNNDTIHFGDSNYEDFTIHKSVDRLNNYIARMSPNQNWNDPSTAGFWSKHILWNKPTLTQSIKDTQKQFNIKINYSYKK